MTTIDMGRPIYMGLVPYNSVATHQEDGIPYMRVNIQPSEPYMRLTQATKDQEISPFTSQVSLTTPQELGKLNLLL